MLFNLKEPLVAGNSFPMTLSFEQAGTVEVTVQVTEHAPASTDHNGHEGHHGHH